MSETSHPLISESVKRYTLGVLVVVYTFNFIDRQILSILIEPIKADLGVSDFGMGLLSVPLSQFSTATSGMPLALIADRWNRRNLIGLSLAIWSGMTALSGLAMNFWQLAAARIGSESAKPGAARLRIPCWRICIRPTSEPRRWASMPWVFRSASCSGFLREAP